jgi:hypothetical protein
VKQQLQILPPYGSMCEGCAYSSYVANNSHQAFEKPSSANENQLNEIRCQCDMTFLIPDSDT